MDPDGGDGGTRILVAGLARPTHDDFIIIKWGRVNSTRPCAIAHKLRTAIAAWGWT